MNGWKKPTATINSAFKRKQTCGVWREQLERRQRAAVAQW